MNLDPLTIIAFEQIWSIVADLNRCLRHGKPKSLTGLDQRCLLNLINLNRRISSCFAGFGAN